jgi:hypothetical protein
MGHTSIFLTLDRLALGVDRLLEFMSDRAAVESFRPPSPPNGALAVRTVIPVDFGDGMRFQINLCSPLPPPRVASSVDPVIRQLLAKITTPSSSLVSESKDLGMELIWIFTEPPPQELLLRIGEGPNPELVEFSKAALSWIFGVSVCEVCYPWIAPKRNPDLRKVRSVLDQYARPRLILPTKDAASFRDDFLALIALFAAKAQCLAPRDDQLPTFFRGYCDRFFGRVRERKKLSQAQWHGVVDRVFQRLYRGQAGMGFTMPVLASSFRAYIGRAIRGQAASEASGGRPIPKPCRFPASIEEAAANLGVSHMTVRRCMKRLQLRDWTEATWMAVSAKITPKKQWQELNAQLRKRGLREDAARKRVQRCKSRGLTPNEARSRNASPQAPKGTCTACKEEQVVGEVYRGKFYCIVCYAEKIGISPTE